MRRDGVDPCFLTAADAATAIREERLTSEALVRSCLERIETRDLEVKAWLHVDRDRALKVARELDKRPRMGPLHGLPVGVKDMIDTADMPTTHNSPLFQENRPARDAACVGVARHSGAIILGKTDTLEFAAAGRRAATRNPHDFAHAPGGSSSGSAAAIGDFHVPLAFGTQTGGSHIRPASFCGIYGLKPTWGVVSREGAKQYSALLDTIGWYGRCVADLALVAEAFRLEGLGVSAPPPPSALRIGYCETPYWSKAEPETRRAMTLAAERLGRAGATIVDLVLPEDFGGLFEAQTAILMGEGRSSFLDLSLEFGPKLHAEFRDRVANTTGVTGAVLREAHNLAASCRIAFEQRFAECDVVLTPAAPGEAPEGTQNVGDWVFNAMWTLLHVPCLAMPCTVGPKGLPVGIQLVAPRFADADLLRAAATIAEVVDCEATNPVVAGI